MNGFLVAAPHSGSGKTVLTLGLLRALRDRGAKVHSAKAGPDYIDPAFHAHATGVECVNLDPWAMRPALIGQLADEHGRDADHLIVEAMMGLFDGASDGSGSAADLAKHLGIPVVLVIDASRMAHSVGALVSGFMGYRNNLDIKGVILNRVGSARHEAMLRAALVPLSIAVLGVVPSDASLSLPSRHLGLVQAREHGALEQFITAASEIIAAHCNLEALAQLAWAHNSNFDQTSPIPPLGNHIAVARDDAFAFCYPHLLAGWRKAGATIEFFSPLADQGPSRDADAVYLPGGYPELHAGTIAAASEFKISMKQAAMRGAQIYGECGGYMVLGEGLVDAHGERHAMLGCLPLVTSFLAPKRHLGYRKLMPLDGCAWPAKLTAHEFHYSTVDYHGEVDALFDVTDASDMPLGQAGMRRGAICGSYMHIIDRAD